MLLSHTAGALGCFDGIVANVTRIPPSKSPKSPATFLEATEVQQLLLPSEACSRYKSQVPDNQSSLKHQQIMPAETRASIRARQGPGRERDGVPDTEEAIEVEHVQTGAFVIIVALKTSEDRDPNRNKMTRACANRLGISNKLKKFKPVWSLPVEGIGGTFDDDEFCIVDSASHEMVLGKSVSDMIFEKKREMSVLAIRVGWLRNGTNAGLPSLQSGLAVSATA